MESTSQFVEIDGSIVNSSAEIVTKGNKDDGIIGVGFCTKPKDLNTISNHMPGQDDDSWGYHDDEKFTILKTE
ncbi:hypothetical protein F8M41_023692 [Gigaspora margarita]|uniref:Uncharacterized protein n=1 Tax=Gigaspora margarita TaxID=4874 RepID=A0A8H4EGU5_GIGMA|nr:hypothetical protein F8M41_023692 [Gigaspora margarita]